MAASPDASAEAAMPASRRTNREGPAAVRLPNCFAAALAPSPSDLSRADGRQEAVGDEVDLGLAQIGLEFASMQEGAADRLPKFAIWPQGRR